MVLFAVFLALFWGVFWAVVLEYTPPGRFLARKRTWITVVIGVGGDLAILALVLEPQTLALVAAIIAVSAVGVIARSLGNEMQEWGELMGVHSDGEDRQ